MTDIPAQNVLEWNIDQVSFWIASYLDLPKYSSQFESNRITGNILIHLTQPDLVDMGVISIGHRLKILKNIYTLIVANNLVTLVKDCYVPPSVIAKAAAIAAATKPHTLQNPISSTTPATNVASPVTDQRIARLEKDFKKLSDNFSRLREDLLPIFKKVKESKPLPEITSSTPSPASTGSPAGNSSSSAATTVQQLSPKSGLSTGSTVRRTSFRKSAYKIKTPTPPATAASPTFKDAGGSPRKLGQGYNAGPSPDYGQKGMMGLASRSHSTSAVPTHRIVAPNPSLGSVASTSSSNSSYTSNYQYYHGTGPESLNSPRGQQGGLSGAASFSSLSGRSSTSSMGHLNGQEDTLTAENGYAPDPLKPIIDFSISPDAPCSDILPIIARKHRVRGDYKSIGLVVCYGDQERIIGLDEKPLSIYKELQREGKNPIFMIREGESGNSEMGFVVSGTPGGLL